MSLEKAMSGTGSKGEPKSWDSLMRIWTRQHAHVVTALTECCCPQRDGVSQNQCLLNTKLPPKLLKPMKCSRHGCWVATTLLVSNIPFKYSSDDQFHQQQRLNNQNPSLLDKGRHLRLSPKALRGPVLHFHTHSPHHCPYNSCRDLPLWTTTTAVLYVLWFSSFWRCCHAA